MKESTGRGPDLQDTERALIIRSNRLKDGLSSASPWPTDGIISNRRRSSSVTTKRKAVAMSRAQLQRGEAVHLESFTIVSYAISLTIGDLSNGST